MTEVQYKLSAAIDAMYDLQALVKDSDEFPKGEDFRGSLDSMILAANYLLTSAANIHQIGKDNGNYKAAKALLEISDLDTRVQ